MRKIFKIFRNKFSTNPKIYSEYTIRKIDCFKILIFFIFRQFLSIKKKMEFMTTNRQFI